MAGPGGGVFGERALNDKKTGGPRTIQAPDGVYTFEEIKHYSAKNFPYFDDKAIIAEYKTGDKQNTIQGRGKGAYVATLGKNGKTKRYIIGYNMEKKTLDAISTVTPGKLKPSLSWKSATGGETLKLQAVTLVKKGKVVTKDWLFGEENVRCYSFTKADKLIESVMEGLKGNPNVTKTIIDCMEEYFAGDLKSIGCDDVPRGHMREIAKYVGEIIPAIAAMKGVDLYVSTPPWNRDKKTDLMVLFPDDPAFKGVDSVIVNKKTGEQYPISSKSAKGAAASFVGNVLETGMKYCDGLQNSYYKELCELKASKPGLKGPAFAYEAGLNKFLDVNVPDPKDILDDIKNNKSTPENIGEVTQRVLGKVRQYPKPVGNVTSPTKDNIDENLPFSLTAFLGREIAAKIMNEKKSVDQIEKILAGKKYYQMNLELNKFLNNVVSFKVGSTDGLKFKLIAGKGSAKDPTMSQGILNFFLV